MLYKLHKALILKNKPVDSSCKRKIKLLNLRAVLAAQQKPMDLKSQISIC